MVDFLFVIIERFSLFLAVETLSGNLSKSAFFEGVGNFELKFQMEEGVAHQPLSATAN